MENRNIEMSHMNTEDFAGWINLSQPTGWLGLEANSRNLQPTSTKYHY